MGILTQLYMGILKILYIFTKKPLCGQAEPNFGGVFGKLKSLAYSWGYIVFAW